MFRVKANNDYGSGTYSTSGSVFTAQEPDTPAAPTLSQTSTVVKITWTEPTYNYITVDAY